jgi:hypothetical protein
MVQTTFLYGLMAEFDDTGKLLDATRQARDAGYRCMEAYTPFPVAGLPELLGVHGRRLPWIVLGGGILGGAGGLFLQWYSAVIDYPWNVGGRPFASWPNFIPIAFETTILVAALSAVFGMLWLNGLPEPYHPVFNVPQFELASRDHFFLVIEADDPQFDQQQTHEFLLGLGATSVTEVPQ